MDKNIKNKDSGNLRAGGKDTEKAIEDSERFFAALSHIGTTGIFRTDMLGNFLYVNERWCKIVGIRQGDALVGGWARAMHPDDRDMVAQAWSAARHARLDFNLEYRIRRPDGEERWVLEQATPEMSASGKLAGYAGTLTDITQSKQMEDQFQRFFNLIPDLACIATIEGRFLKINSMWQEVLGYSEKKILATPFLDLIHPDDREATMKEVERQLAGYVTLEFVNRYRHKNGSYRWLEWRATPAVDGKLLFASARDITERRQLEEVKQEALQRLQHIASQVPGVVYQFRLNPDGRATVPYASEAAREIYRLDPEEVREDASKVFDYVHPEDLESFKASMQESARDLTPWHHEYRLKFDDGTERWILGNSVPQREADGSTLWHGFLTDITERRKIEEQLEHNRELLQAYLDNVSDTIWLFDAQQNIIHVSAGVTNLLGFLPEDLIGRPGALVLHPNDKGIIDKVMRYVLGHPGEPHTIQYRVRHKDGRWVYVESTGTNMLDNPVIGGVLVAMRDISKRKLAEEALRASEQRYRLLVESSPFCIHEIDLKGRMQSMNKAGLDMLGVSDVKEILGMPYLHAVSREDVGRVGALMQDAITNGTPSYFEFTGTGDKQPYFKSCFIPIRDDSGNMMKLMGITEDITERRQLEAALRHSEETLNIAQNIAQTGSWYLNIPANRLEWSLETYRMFGITPQEAIDLETFAAVIHPEDRDFVLKAWGDAMAGAPYDIEHRIVVKGQERWVRERARIERDSEGRPLSGIGTVQDITDRKLSEQILAESEGRFREIFNAVSDAIFIHDAETGRILDVNRRMLEMYRLKREEALACEIKDLSAGVPPYSSAEAAEKIRLARTEGPQTFVWHARARDGHLFWVEVSLKFALIGSQQRILATVRDINERKQSEAALQESEYRWKFALEGSGDGLWDWNLADNTVFFSRRWKEMLGYSDDEIGNGLDEWEKRIHPDDKAETLATVKAYLDGETPVYQNEHRVSCKDGSWKWILDRGMVVSRDEQGKPLRMIGTHADITERKKAEEQIHNLAFYDTLTQLPNRRMLNDRMHQAMASSKRSGRYGALLFLDLDNFKPLNDTYGHAVGDLLLKEVARRISGCVREMDTVARFGGDEFVVMLTELDPDPVESTAQAGIVAEKIRIILAEPYVLKVHHEGAADTTVEHHCTSSIGAVLFLNHKDSSEDILKWADMAMYQAKEDGRNLIRFHASGK